jgi:hypothetical protein
MTFLKFFLKFKKQDPYKEAAVNALTKHTTQKSTFYVKIFIF